MTAKESLERMEQLSRLIPACEKRIAQYRDLMGIQSTPTDTEHVSHTRNVDALCDKVAVLVDTEAELDAMRTELDELRAQEMRWIGWLSEPREILFMTARYISGQSNG